MSASASRLVLCLVVLSAAGASAAPPVAFDGIAPAVAGDTTTQVRLPYQDADGDRATSCSVTSQMLTLEQACQCDAAGACSVGVQGLPDAHGEASFAYDITAGGETSPRATVRLEVLPTADRPQAVTSRHPAFAVNAAAILELPYRDPDGPARACRVSSLVNVRQTRACRCEEGVCTVGVVGLPEYRGTASLQFTISDGTLVSLAATASLAVGEGVAAVRIPRARDYFGFSVAARGSRFVAGAPGEAGTEPRVGAAYLYVDLDGDGDWSDRRLEARLQAADGSAGDHFGAVVAIGERVIAVLEDTESWFPAAPNQLHVFTDPSGRGRWRLRNVIERPRGAGRFGGGVATGPGFEALAIDGARIALGAYQDVSGSGGERTGAVYLYEDPNADLDWSDAVRTRLVASDARAGAGFGIALDGDRLGVGAPDQDVVRDGATLANAGAVYVFQHDGAHWREQARLVLTSATDEGYFGSTVDLVGTTLVASATGGFEQGAVHVFESIDDGWREQPGSPLRPAAGSARDAFGSGGVAVAGDRVFVASPLAEQGAGALSVFRARAGNGTGEPERDWSEAVERRLRPRVASQPSSSAASDYFGCSFDIAGGTLIVGAFDEDGDGALPPNDALPDAGAVYLFVPADAADGADRDVGGAWREHVYAK